MEIGETANQILADSVRASSQGTLIVLEGAIDLESAARLDAEFAQAAFAGARPITLDASGLEGIDAVAISSVLRGMRTLLAAGVELDVRYPSPMAPDLFEACRLLQIVGIEFARVPHKLSNDQVASTHDAHAV
jgi:anti-anti-sigma factor